MCAVAVSLLCRFLTVPGSLRALGCNLPDIERREGAYIGSETQNVHQWQIRIGELQVGSLQVGSLQNGLNGQQPTHLSLNTPLTKRSFPRPLPQEVVARGQLSPQPHLRLAPKGSMVVYDLPTVRSYRGRTNLYDNESTPNKETMTVALSF